MKKLILGLVLVTSGCASVHTPYVKIGAGYKTAESYIEWDGNNDDSILYDISCKAEIGAEYNNLSYGFRHVSQCFVGAPFNDYEEYMKNELFADYKYYFKL